MIRAHVHFLPASRDREPRSLGTLEITNDESGGAREGNYRVRWLERHVVKREGAVRGFPRLEGHVLDLIGRAVESVKEKPCQK